MRYILAAFLLLLIVDGVDAQPFINEKSYLNSTKISLEAKLLYSNKIKAPDNDTTERILDSLDTHNDFARPFYIMVVSRLIEKADGALGEMVFTDCEVFFEKRPDGLIEFLYSPNNSGRKYKLNWARAIAWGVELGKSENVKPYLDKMKAVIAKKIKQKNIACFEEFYSNIYKQL